MKFKDWIINERRRQYNSNNVIVVDIQPEYANGIRFDIGEFSDFLCQMLERGKRVLYFHNGPDLGMSNADQIKQYLLNYDEEEMYDYDDEYDDYATKPEVEEKMYALNNITFYDKGYGFFRGWMDSGIDESIIIRAVREMIMRRVNDSRELPEEVLEDLGVDGMSDDINLPHIDIGQLRQFSGAFLCGGGVNECLREVQLLMSALNIRTTVMSQFTF